jgi:Ca-activated chloride channel family protein
VVRGRYRGAAPELRWTAAGRRKRPGGSVSGAEVADPAARPLWARARIRDLEDAYAAAAHDHDHDPEQQAAEIVSLSLATGVLSRFTAFVAVDLSERVDSTSPQPVVQPVEAPSGWAAGSPPGAAMAPPMPAPMLASQPLAAMKPGASRGGPAAPPPPSSAMPPPAPFAAPVPPASPLPVSGAAGGLRRTTMRRKRQGDAPPVDRVVGTDLSRYLDRLDELLASIDAGGTGADVERDLRDLADDLRSVDAPKDLVGAIEHLLAKLDEAGAAAPEAVAALRDAMRAVRDGGARAGRSSTAGDPDRRRSKRFWR